MITKVYFPRLVIPISSVLSGVVDLAVAFVVLLGIIAYYNYAPNPVAAQAPPALSAVATPAPGGEGTASGTSSTVENGTAAGYHVTITSRAWLLPLFLLLAILTALGVGLWLSALNVAYRDIGYILPFLTQFWLFITPIAYPSSLIPEKWRLIYALNPMTGVVEGFRWSLLGSGTPPGPMLAVSTAITLVILVTGLFYFRRMERTFADMV
jgi:lipopolysaccharide transport system permease protein